MPSRLIREGILTSDRVEQLDPPAEVFYRRLMSKVDDHGLYDARPSILRASLYPLRIDRVREADCTRWMAACQMAGLIVLYQHDGKPYLQVLDTRWQTRSEAKYPLPDVSNCLHSQTDDASGEQLQAVEINGKQLLTGVYLDGDVVVSECENARERAPRENPWEAERNAIAGGFCDLRQGEKMG